MSRTGSNTVRDSREEALLIRVALSDQKFDDDEDYTSGLEDERSEAVRWSAAGWHDGTEFGGGYATIVLHGPSAERLAEVTLPVLKDAVLQRGCYAVKRFGPPGGPEERVELCFDPPDPRQGRLL